MEPTIVRKDAFTVIGIAGPSSQSDNRIPALWRKFMAREEEVTDRAPGGGGYGICGYLDASTMDEDTEWEELVGDEVLDTAQPPAGMVKRTIAAGRYAVFTHKGGVESIGATYQYIYGTYIPRSGLTLAKAPDFEYYDGRFKPETPEESEMFIYIPLAD